jgi:uncharacterized membrane protein (UPF0127 family)
MTSRLIQFNYRKIAFFGLLLLALASACRHEPINLNTLSRDALLKLPSGDLLRTTLAISDAEQTRGLSGTLSSQWGADQAMLFLYKEQAPRRFWMPDTYFDLDIFFLNVVKNGFKVIDLQRNVPHHPGRSVPPEIATTRTVTSQMVLELRADSLISKKIEVGHFIEWKSSVDLQALVEALPSAPKGY